MKNLYRPLDKSVLIPLRLIAADAGLHKKLSNRGCAQINGLYHENS